MSPFDIARLVDAAIRDELHASHDLYFVWLILATVAVAVGVALEGPEIVINWREGFRGYEPSKSLKKKVVALAGIGWLLIAIGVGAEAGLEVQMSNLDSRLQTFEDILLTEQRLEISTNEVQVSSVRLGVEQARALAAGFQVQIASANARTAEAAKATAQLRLDLTASNQQLAAEQIKLQQEQQKTAIAQTETAKVQREVNQTLASALLPRSPKREYLEALKGLPPGSAEIIYPARDWEAGYFAQRLQGALAGLNWRVAAPTAVALEKFDGSPFPILGVMVQNSRTTALFPIGGPPQNPTILSEMLALGEDKGPGDMRLALLLIALKATPWKDESLSSNSFRIIIGPRDTIDPF